MAVPMWGRHNIKNATAALAACAQGFGVRLDALGPALAAFKGVKRRLELLGTPREIAVYDDFAHHPTAVETTLRGLKQRHKQGRLLVLFEPRSATACRNLHQQQYVGAFAAADQVLLAPLGRQNLPEAERLDPVRLARDLEQQGTPAQSFQSVDEMVQRVAEHAKPGDVVIALSNGAFGGVHDKLLAALS
jgi:UDP-N-acetylmuramate: L-alanyl-gamma-D-glutamyl-meso-diaminopimelate ligase